jgi:hypothetical protein
LDRDSVVNDGDVIDDLSTDEDDAVDWLGGPRLELLVKDDVTTYQGKATHI